MKPVHTSLLAPFAAAPGHFQAMANPQERLLYSSDTRRQVNEALRCRCRIRRRLNDVGGSLQYELTSDPTSSSGRITPLIGRLRNTQAQAAPAAPWSFRGAEPWCRGAAAARQERREC